MIPRNWRKSKLSEISLITMGQSPSSQSYNDYGEGLPFFQGKAEFGKIYPTARKWCTDPKKIAEEGDILISVRAPVGPTNIASSECCIGRGLAAINSYGDMNQQFLFYYFRNIEPWLSEQGTGTTFKAIGSNFLHNLEVPIAPFKEQKRIADKLDTLTARIETCREHLDRVPEILKQFRQSVLAAAVSGKLTEEWREENGVSFESWKTSTFGESLDLIDGDRGTNYPKQSDYLAEGHCLFLSTKNVREFGFLFNETMFISEKKHKTLRSGTVQLGDVIVTTRGTLGNVAYFDETIPYNVVRINSGMLILRGKVKNITGKFLMVFVASPIFFNELEKKRSGSAQPQIPKNILKTFGLSIPPIEEQQEIVRRVDTLFYLANELEAHYQASLNLLSTLSPSTLDKAFQGELVPQDPNDEPASVLLERIRLERENTPKEKKKPQRRKTMETIKGQKMSIVQVLKESGKEISASELFQAAGYPYDAESEVVEEFFVDLRDAINNRQIKKRRIGEEDWFSLS